MKLPSGREISIDRLVDVAEMLGEESFYLDDMGDAEEEVHDRLGNECFSLNGTEKPFEDEDVEVIIRVVKSAAERLSGELYKLAEIRRPLTKMMVEVGVESADH